MKTLIVTLFMCCVAACAVDDGMTDEGMPVSNLKDGAETTDAETADDIVMEPFDPERVATIAKAKMALLGTSAISQAAACGTAGPTSTSERVNDAAFTGTARQRTGSSTSCTSPGALQPTDDALYYCYTCVGPGCIETWTYNQNLRTKVRGWTRDDLLRPPPGADFGGARNSCPPPL